MGKTKKTDNRTPDTKAYKTDAICIDFHGAAIIDDNGKEIPITEEMVKQACQEIDKKIS